MDFFGFINKVYVSVMLQAKQERNLPGIICDVATDARCCKVDARSYIAHHYEDFGGDFISAVAKLAYDKGAMWMPGSTTYFDLHNAWEVMSIVQRSVAFANDEAAISTAQLLYDLGVFSLQLTSGRTPMAVLRDLKGTAQTDIWQALAAGYNVLRNYPNYDLVCALCKLYWLSPRKLRWVSNAHSIDAFFAKDEFNPDDKVYKKLEDIFRNSTAKYSLETILKHAATLPADAWQGDYVHAFVESFATELL